MNKSDILQQDHEQMVSLCKRMTPQERLLAYLRHSQLITQIYQAGIRYRSRPVASSGQKTRSTRGER